MNNNKITINNKLIEAASIVRWHLEENDKSPTGENVAQVLKDQDVIKALKHNLIDVTVLGDYFGRYCYLISYQIKQAYEEKAKLT